MLLFFPLPPRRPLHPPHRPLLLNVTRRPSPDVPHLPPNRSCRRTPLRVFEPSRAAPFFPHILSGVLVFPGRPLLPTHLPLPLPIRTIPYHSIPYHGTYHTIPSHAIRTIPSHAISYHTIPHHTYHTIPYVPYHPMPYHTVQGMVPLPPLQGGPA